MERAVLLADDQVIHARHLPPTLQLDDETPSPSGSLEARLGALERDIIDDALKRTQGNMAEAARQLGLTERKMGLRVRRHGLDPRRHRR
jgi:Nif-specific regulatory protein